MKRYCKNVNILDPELISRSVYECLNGKYGRRDTNTLLAECNNITPKAVAQIYKEQGRDGVLPLVPAVIDKITAELKSKSLNFTPIWYRQKLDGSSGKLRRIGIQNVKQQIYDYIAVNALTPIFSRIGEHQYARKGKGPEAGVKTIRKWLREQDIRYSVQLDIRKCYESIPKDLLMAYLRKYVANNNLLWLIDRLLDSFDKGLSIGSYLSQFLCDLYLSQIYHYMSEQSFRIRNAKTEVVRVRTIKHILMYRDDILLLCNSYKLAKQAIKDTIHIANRLGLEIKPSITVKDIRSRDKDTVFIDMMGYRIYRYHTTIRRRLFKRLRRAFLRAQRKGVGNIQLARRCISYLGRLKHSNSRKFILAYNVQNIGYKAKRRVSNYDKSKLRHSATAC